MRRLLPLIITLLMVVAASGPTNAVADTWTVGGEEIGESTETAEPFTGTGTFAETLFAKQIRQGPCEVHVEGQIWNEEGTAHGEINNLAFTVPCDLSYMGVKICTITSKFSENFPWTFEVTGGTAVDIYDVNFAETLSEGCIAGPPTTGSGLLTGTFDNETSSIVFDDGGDLELAPFGSPVYADGGIALSSTGEDITLHGE